MQSTDCRAADGQGEAGGASQQVGNIQVGCGHLFGVAVDKHGRHDEMASLPVTIHPS